ncbi:creatinine amidohydrolase [Clostridium cavendishii DSM 21758]|uniref:Creatinine amidohydrolase n=1 Tax=Clostridium cavendishii DSM 21758 TaxID=1121302 RepID=A0A1M6MRQ7_9CLOT|nr:creatininase family protein [Clostridium cavendishii]SHJ86079.1 creatinine amidohydrolase [Clostridium cavendishii DSM 21758]
MINEIFKDTMVNMNWTEIQNFVDKNALVLLPMGVIEEHGPQLCLGTDIYTAYIYCLAIKEKLEKSGHTVVIAPPFYWGVCQSTSGFIGSFHVRKNTARALIYDILLSLSEFGFNNVFGVNVHGDIEHNIAIIEAFKEAQEQLDINACYAFDECRFPHFKLKLDEPYLCPIKTQTINVSKAEISDVHGGDIETAMMYEFYPTLVDVEKAISLPPITLDNSSGEDWLFGGHIKELSSQGYLGSPADFKDVEVQKNVDDYAYRISEAILRRIV